MKLSNKLTNHFGGILFFILPIFSIVITCLRLQFDINKINLLGNIGNDEVVYYKMVESVINFGFPQGYYGYNESHAAIGNFSTWGPMPLLLWSIAGKIIGWNLISPIICNTIFLSIALFIFYACIVSTPPQKNALILGINANYPLFVSAFLGAEFISFACLTTLPEVCLYFYSIIAIGLSINLYHTDNHWKIKLFFLFLIISLATLTRPFYAFLLILPVYFFIKKSASKKTATATCLIIFGMCALIYVLLYKYFSAPYLHPLLGDNISAKESNSIISIWNKCMIIARSKFNTAIMLSKEALIKSSFYGAVFICYCIITFMYLAMLIYKLICKNRDALVYGYFLIYMIIMLLAAFIMIESGAEYKHLCELIVIGMLVILFFCDKLLPKIILSISLLTLMLWFNPLTPQFVDPVAIQTIETTSAELNKQMPLTQSDNPYDNTIIWLSYDEGNVWYQGLYAIPKGYGISMCTQEYILDNFDSLNSKYLYTRTDGKVAQTCIEHKKKVISQFWGMTIFKLRD